jgi:competence protein ComEA
MRRLSAVLALMIVSLSAPLAAQEKKATPKAAAVTAAAPVNLNTASAAQIAALPGIGPKAAERIVEYRQKHGGFKKIEELMNVKGIGEKSFLKLKSLITVTEKAGGTRQ